MAIRFAPSPTGFAHPGTLFSALMVWLEGQRLKLPTILRFDDIDILRFKPKYEYSMLEALNWLGLKFKNVFRQSDQLLHYQKTLQNLCANGHVYVCTCSRKDLQERSRLSMDGSWRYDGKCRSNLIDKAPSQLGHALRLKIGDHKYKFFNPDKRLQEIHPLNEFGDPIVLRKSGVPSYHFSSVVDDINFNISTVVRGHDLIGSSSIHTAIHDLLNQPPPQYKFHGLVLDTNNQKLSKSDDSINYKTLKTIMTAEQLLGIFAKYLKLQNHTDALSLGQLQEVYDWKSASKQDNHWETT